MRNFKKKTEIMKPVLTKGKFVCELKREYALSCRTGKPFELIIFTFTDENYNTGVFLEVLLSRVRTTDIVGWLDNNKVGIILYDADVSVSNKFIDSLREKILNANILFPRYDTYIYPFSDSFNSINQKK